MTSPLDEKAVELAAREIAANDWSVDSNMTKREWQDARWIYHRDDAESAIRAYLAASPSPSEMEVVAWRYRANAEDHWQLSDDGPKVLGWKAAYDAETEPLVTFSQAQSALAAMRAERDEAKREAQEADGPDEHGFVVGEPVEKFTGEARWEGILVSAYRMTSGHRRYVVEVKPQGFQMIAVPSQLRMIATLQEEQRAQT